MSGNLEAAFRAGFVRRWHTNPDLAHTCDRVDAHSARVARIILALHPDPSAALLRAALTHDDGESEIGDLKGPAKEADSALADALRQTEEQAAREIWGTMPRLEGNDARWLHFADRLDAYMWAAHHAPHALGSDGWPQALLAIVAMARELNISLQAVAPVLGLGEDRDNGEPWTKWGAIWPGQDSGAEGEI